MDGGFQNCDLFLGEVLVRMVVWERLQPTLGDTAGNGNVTDGEGKGGLEVLLVAPNHFVGTAALLPRKLQGMVNTSLAVDRTKNAGGLMH
ncbi:hypothetical protein BDV11DRAFT_185235 [Aspergillus similis]